MVNIKITSVKKLGMRTKLPKHPSPITLEPLVCVMDMAIHAYSILLYVDLENSRTLFSDG